MPIAPKATADHMRSAVASQPAARTTKTTDAAMLRIPRTRNPTAGNFGVAIRHHLVSRPDLLCCNGSTHAGRGLGPAHIGTYACPCGGGSDERTPARSWCRMCARALSQLAHRMRVLMEWAMPPPAVWMPQIAAARCLERATIK